MYDAYDNYENNQTIQSVLQINVLLCNADSNYSNSTEQFL